MNNVNLVPLSRRQAAARRRRARLWTLLASCYALLLVLGYGLSLAAISSAGEELTDGLEKSVRQIDDLNHAAASLRPQLNEAQQRVNVARTVGDQPDWSLLLSMISSVVDNEVVLTSMKMEPVAAPVTQPAKGKTSSGISPPAMVAINLQGLSRSQASTSQFALRLERLDLFERVDLLNSGRAALGNGEANAFRIECLLRRSGKSASGTTGGTNAGGKR